MDKWYFVECEDDGKFFCVDSEGKVTISFWYNSDRTYSEDSLEHILKNFKENGYKVTELGSLESEDMSDLVELCNDSSCICHSSVTPISYKMQIIAPNSDSFIYLPLGTDVTTEQLQVQGEGELIVSILAVAIFILLVIGLYLTITNFLI